MDAQLRRAGLGRRTYILSLVLASAWGLFSLVIATVLASDYGWFIRERFAWSTVAAAVYLWGLVFGRGFTGLAARWVVWLGMVPGWLLGNSLVFLVLPLGLVLLPSRVRVRE